MPLPVAMRQSRMAMAAALVCLFFTGLWGFDIQGQRPAGAGGMHALRSYGKAVGFHPFAATAVLAGFRGFAADLLWLKSDTYWHHGQWQRMLPLYYLIVELQPRFTMVWCVGGWHMAYNLSHRAKSNAELSPSQRDEQARQWVDKGIQFLQEGLPYNEDKPELYFDLGWTYFDKVKEYPAAVHYLEEAAKISDTTLNLRVLAHAYKKAGRAGDALKVWKILEKRGDAVAKRFTQELTDKR